MKVKSTYLSVIWFTLLFAGISTVSIAQGTLGIVWDTPTDTAEASRQLELFSELGITYLELNHPVDSQTLKLLEQKEFTVLVRIDKTFLTVSDIRARQNSLLDSYLSVTDRYRTHFNIPGIGLVTNSQTSHPDFIPTFSSILDSLNQQSNKSFYFYLNEAWYNFESPSTPFGKYIFKKDFQFKDLTALEDIFRLDITDNPNIVHFFQSSWFLDAIEQYPPLQTSLIYYLENQQWEMPLPETTSQSVSQNWMVLLLLLLWAGLAAQLKYLPYIRPMMIRYFLAHRFFVDDILHYRERASIGGVLLMIKHVIFGGIVFYLSSKMLLDETGLQAFFHHLPALAIAGSNYASFFLLGIILVLIMQFIAILWLFLPAKTIEHVSQTINLYAGIFYLDFIIVTLMVTLYTAGTGSSLILTLAIVFILIWFGAFSIAAFDASKNMGAGSIIYLLLTFGLHTIATIVVLALLFFKTEFIEIMNLAISL